MSDSYLDALRLEQQPSKAYDGADTREAIAAVNKAEHLAARKRTKTPTGAFLPADAWQFLAEDHRRAHARLIAATPRQRVVTERVGGVTITRPYTPRPARDLETLVCATCGEPKPENKFPTSKPGVREATCRECKHAAVAARKAARAGVAS